MNERYRPLWKNAASAIFLIFVLIFSLSAVLTENALTIQTYTGVAIGFIYVVVFRRLAEQRAQAYLVRKKLFGKADYTKQARATEILLKVPDSQIDGYGKALREDIRRLGFCYNVYAAVVIGFYLLSYQK